METQPRWTVLYNIVSESSDWIGTGREFFDTEFDACSCYNKQLSNGNCPTRRPYDHNADNVHLGAVHQPNCSSFGNTNLINGE